MFKKLTIVLMIFLLLITARFFRWDYQVTHSLNAGSYKVIYKSDRWLNQRWAQISRASFYDIAFREYPVVSGKIKSEIKIREDAWEKRNLATKLWNLILAGNIVVIFGIVIQHNKDKKNNGSSC